MNSQVVTIAKRDATSSVYLIKEGDSTFYKIGKGAKPQTRLGSLQVGNPRLLHLVSVLWVTSHETAFALEALLHERYASYRVKGEWFNFPQSTGEIVESMLHIALNNSFVLVPEELTGQDSTKRLPWTRREVITL